MAHESSNLTEYRLLEKTYEGCGYVFLAPVLGDG
jgi:hypothetical protein